MKNAGPWAGGTHHGAIYLWQTDATGYVETAPYAKTPLTCAFRNLTMHYTPCALALAELLGAWAPVFAAELARMFGIFSEKLMSILHRSGPN
jgi:hypothetical protein